MVTLTPAATMSRANTKVSLAEIISALSFALDLTEGAVHGHAVRSCLLGMRVAHEIGLPNEQCSSLYYALLLKDIGCSSNAGRMFTIVGGDDRAVKAGAKLEDWTKPHRASMRTLRMLWHNVLPNSNALLRAIRLGKMGMTQHRNNEEMISLRCERGARIVRKLDMGEAAAQAVYHLDENWNGGGYPKHLKGENIPLLSRICSIAQNLEGFSSEDGHTTAIDVLRDRSGTWFDPDLVSAALSLHARGELWRYCDSFERRQSREAVLDLDPCPMEALGPERVDNICQAFAEVVDAKSPFTYRHSVGVTDVAWKLAATMGMTGLQQQMVKRGALLHDLGKLRVPNSILDKKSHLNDEEWKVIREHPILSGSILGRVAAFEELAIVASQHHEKLDGSGYPWGLKADDLSMETRLLTMADIYGAMAEERPYRGGIDPREILRLLEPQVPGKLDPMVFEALH